jgi:hypothetical protein
MANLEGNCFLTVVYLLAKMTLYSPSGAVLTIKVVVKLRDMSKEDTSEPVVIVAPVEKNSTKSQLFTN